MVGGLVQGAVNSRREYSWYRGSSDVRTGVLKYQVYTKYVLVPGALVGMFFVISNMLDHGSWILIGWLVEVTFVLDEVVWWCGRGVTSP